MSHRVSSAQPAFHALSLQDNAWEAALAFDAFRGRCDAAAPVLRDAQADHDLKEAQAFAHGIDPSAVTDEAGATGDADAITRLCSDLDERLGTYEAHIGLSHDGTGESWAVLRAWHRTCWEAGYACDILAEGRRFAARHRLVIHCSHEARAPRTLDEGHHLLVDSSGALERSDEGLIDSDDLVYRISRARRTANRSLGAQKPGARAGHLLTVAHPSLTRALDTICDPAPALRALCVPTTVPRGAADSQVYARYDTPEGPLPVLVRMAGTWMLECGLDAASRRALLGLLTAHARILPVRSGLPDGIEACRRGDVLLVLNHSDSARELSGIIGFDAVSASECTGHVLLAPQSYMAIVPGTIVP